MGGAHFVHINKASTYKLQWCRREIDHFRTKSRIYTFCYSNKYNIENLSKQQLQNLQKVIKSYKNLVKVNLTYVAPISGYVKHTKSTSSGLESDLGVISHL